MVGGECERCHGEVVRKVKSQWMLKITDYAQKLLDGLDEVDYIERVKTAQKNWIGRSTGAEVTFKTTAGEDLVVYTTRPDTLFGATYMVIAPEHPYLELWKDKLKNFDEVKAYQERSAKKSDFERTELAKDKTGVKLSGVTAINPVNQAEIPIFISDYVLMSYGTGAIMAVPAHDTRDYEFAKVFDLPIIEVVQGGDVSKEAYTDTQSGIMINSGFLNGLTVEEAKEKIKDWLVENKVGEPKVNFKLRDWVFSRQRYWGEPIPLVHCETCGWVPVPEEELPLTLPDVESYLPTDNGESPLATLESFINTTCPKCGGPGKRETDTMPQWAGSSWYFLRYCDPTNEKELASKEALEYWMPVDWYNGGMEHTTLHLLYSRFWHKFLYDQKIVHTKEPYARRTSHGMVLGEDGQKCPNPEVTLSILTMLFTNMVRIPFAYMKCSSVILKTAPWSVTGIKGCRRFLDRVWGMQEIVTDGDGYSKELESAFHKTIKKVSQDIENLKFNTAIAALMSLTNDIYAKGSVTKHELFTFVTLLNPFAPHVTEELNETLKLSDAPLSSATWCTYDEALCKDDMIEIAVQINGKIRARIEIAADANNAAMIEAAKKQRYRCTTFR